MNLKIDSTRCTGCRICEFACNYHSGDDFTTYSGSLMLHRTEKKDYYGVMWKRKSDIYLARPEGAEIMEPGAKMEGAAGSKPITMRPACDLCEGMEELYCVLACPTGCLTMEEG